MSAYHKGSWNWIATFRDPVSYMVYDVNGPGGYVDMDEAKAGLADFITSGQLFTQTRVRDNWPQMGVDLLWTNNYGR
jgi:hypothetical protein